MRGYIENIEKATLENTDYRRVIYTTEKMQLVLMNLQPGEEIGLETHNHITQFLRIEQGQADVFLNGEKTSVRDDFAIIVPGGTKHNVVNTGDTELKLYTLYSPPEHRLDVVEPTKADEVEEHFDGRTSLTD